MIRFLIKRVSAPPGKQPGRLLSLCFIYLTAISVSGQLPTLWAADKPSVAVHAIDGPIHVDGVLSEAPWQAAPAIQNFTQAEPRAGEAPAEITRVWLAFTPDALYIAVNCFDRQPRSIVATQMSRDAELRDNDNLELILDTYNDHRNAYYFSTNPAGALVDGRVTDNRLPSMDWDGIWRVRTQISDQGWTAEFEIPFKTLGFTPAISDWGFNISRHIARVRERSRWASPSFDVRLYHAVMAGDITGMEGLSQGVGLDVKPYGLIGADRDVERQDRVSVMRDAGLDLFYRLTPNLVSSTTFNTDFAETEVDTRQVNLTRFSLFFPEKRSFFLEDAGIFEFAQIDSGRGGGGRGGRRRPDFMPFFSRRIGMIEGNEAPIRVGQKITGKIGRVDVGLLDVQTGALEEDGELVAKGRNLAVARIKANFGSQSYFGAMFTNGDPTGEANNQVTGADLKLATSNFLNSGKNMQMMLFGSHSRTGGLQGKDNAFGGSVSYPNDFLDAEYNWMEIGENYNPALGYVPRRGVRISSAQMQVGPRPRFWGLRRASFDISYKDYYSLSQRASETTVIEITPLQLRFNSADALSYRWTRTQERLFEPWEIRDGITLAPAKYWFSEQQVRFETSASRPISMELRASGGDFYSGSRKSAEGTLSWRSGRRLSTAFSWEQNWVRLPEASFKTSLPMYRLDYSFTPYITLASFIQYDTDSRDVGLQSRLRWIFQPGNELYIVLNHSWQENAFDRFEAAQTRFRAKLNYTLRF